MQPGQDPETAVWDLTLLWGEVGCHLTAKEVSVQHRLPQVWVLLTPPCALFTAAFSLGSSLSAEHSLQAHQLGYSVCLRYFILFGQCSVINIICYS